MPKQAQSRRIDGYEIQVQPLPAFAAISLFTRIGKSIGGALGPTLAALASAGVDKLQNVDVSQHLGALFAALSPDEIEQITKALLQGAVLDPNGKTRLLLDVADYEFQGQTLTLIKAALFAFEVNYGDFRDLVRGMLAGARAKTESKANPSPA